MLGFIIWICISSLLFAVIEYFTVRSALRTGEFTDPLAKSSLVGVAASRSKVLRVVLGTFGALAAATILGMLISMAVFALTGIEMK